MSLQARISIGSSRRVVLLERFATAGALALVVATCAARWSSSWPIAIGFIGLGVWVATTLLVRRSPVPDAEFVIGERTDVEVHRCDDRPVEHRVLDEDSLLWPGLAVLRLVPAPFSAGRPCEVVVFEHELAPSDARHLRRFLLWVSRGGVRPGPSVDRPS